MKKLVILFTVVLLCFTTCTKEEKNENLCYSPDLISQVNSGDVAVHGLSYNSDCMIYESTEPFTYRKFTYDSEKRLDKVEVATSLNAFSCVMIPGQSFETDPRKAAISQYYLFEYNNDSKITKKSTYFINNGNSQLTYYQTYDYNNNSLQRINTFNSQGSLISYSEYSYDSKGNVLMADQYELYSGLKHLYAIVYEYDNKINPYRVFAGEGIPGKYTNTNNIIKETTISYNGISESRYSKVYEYSYNSQDYPVKINGLVCLYGK